jgi:hypothetical protein
MLFEKIIGRDIYRINVRRGVVAWMDTCGPSRIQLISLGIVDIGKELDSAQGTRSIVLLLWL